MSEAGTTTAPADPAKPPPRPPVPPLGSTPRARTVIEALPWLEAFQGRVVVIKFGGNAMVDEELKRAFAQDVVSLRYAGLRPVVVHGGGPQISSLLHRLDLEVRFAAGLRVTTPEIMDVVRMVLAGQVQREIVGLINAHGPFAVGMTGEDAHTLTAVRRPAWVNGEPVDIGLVGDIVRVDPDTLGALLDRGRIPVVSPIARGDDGQTYNINADLAASALAVALNAEKLVMLTDVEGVYSHWPESTDVIERLTAGALEELLPTLASGMVPKMEGCLRAVRAGVRMAHVLDGRVPHSLLLEVFADDTTGTTVVPDDAPHPGAQESRHGGSHQYAHAPGNAGSGG
ncbi:acetylglutamate kinase [Streptomyces albipurpureus]|uniref:Acetylglutamate kinase n=1 Tax=Streptomyces albipurpureus TaxID=2897419 RepID=A0ABT0UWD8_9ACTN|nr:acetylglutamate kinase [Streptomyces sp. CWNU-1]MCM2392759.1 acetylglutamate kinase [Streptomyces sp. CWNU-1]